MPRQDVPYGGAICRLKERIAEIWDKLGEKLHSVNGVTGDAAGNVEIVSGDAAITVSEDQVNHTIEIGMDRGELPSAAVTSVNGETGAVALDANDIPSNDGTVQSDIMGFQTDISGINIALANETNNRLNAESALQGNINAVQASIPGAAATAVANDPTVAQLATDVPNKLDKITSGNSLKAYTHTGATQGETAISSGTDANSIGLRDANGRMYGADPASGATDRSLTTANWISQTGAGKPNNLLHDTGNENFSGAKNGTISFNIASILSGSLDPNQDYYKWFKVAKIQPGRYARLTYNISFPYNNSRYMIMDVVIITARTQNITTSSLVKMSQVANMIDPSIKYLAIAYDGTDINIYIKSAQFTHQTLYATAATSGGNIINASDIITPLTPTLEDPTTQQFYLEI